MSRSPYRHERKDHISRIQANLKEMKNQVSQFLKRNSNEVVPPILRTKHHLVLSSLNHPQRNINSNSKEQLKMIKEISSERIGIADASARTASLKEATGEKVQKNRIVKQKRTPYLNKNVPPSDADCLLPNICQLKLDFQDAASKSNPRRSRLEGKTLEINYEYDSSDSFLKQRRFHSIDLNRQSKLSQNAESSNPTAFRVTSKWISASKSKELINTLQKKHSWSDKVSQEGLPYQDIVANQTIDLSQQKIKEGDTNKLNSKKALQQRKESILKRRIEANLKQAKEEHQRHKRQILLKKQLKESMKKALHFEQQSKEAINHSNQFCDSNNTQCSPWFHTVPEKEISLMYGQIF